ncbi:hypothetical protein D3C78_1165860 [compost metagenome]
MDGDASRSCGLPEECHSARIASEVCNIPLNPFKRSNLVCNAAVVWTLSKMHKAIHAHPIVYRDNHDAFFSKHASVINRLCGIFPDPGSSGDPHHDG